jgi:SpoVK/Ycf46/Vps4 family AAA+-type ATPase
MSESLPMEINDTRTGTEPEVRKTVRKFSELEVLIRARYPLIYVVTWEEQRVLSLVNRIAGGLDKKVFEWSLTTGLVSGGTEAMLQKNKDTATQDPLVAMDKVLEMVDPALYVFKDLHAMLGRHNMAIIRRLREIAASLKNTYKTIVIVSPMLEIPPELEKDLTVVDFDLPRAKDFAMLLDRIIEEVKGNPKLDVNIHAETREAVIHALMGLTLSEAENVLAKTLVRHRGFGEKSVEVILSEKKQVIRKSGMLEYYESQENMATVGGLDGLKTWLLKRAVAFTDKARSFGLPSPRGVLLLGVQGCGKSLMAKAISQVWRLPLLRFDVGKVFGSLVGSSEENVRRAIQVAESISPAILWIDEIDKAFRGSQSSGGNTDGGTSARVFGTFLSWMSDKTAPVFVVATANDISHLPPELLRKGRFDEIFFVDLPSKRERMNIFDVHLKKKGRDSKRFDLDRLATVSKGFSGAEIEEAITSSLFDAFYEQKDLSTEGILEAIRQTVPLSKTMSEQIDDLRKWASGRARPANTPESADEEEPGKRKLEL